jgi:hypothetical protein
MNHFSEDGGDVWILLYAYRPLAPFWAAANSASFLSLSANENDRYAYYCDYRA